MQEPTNVDRAGWARVGLAAFSRRTGEAGNEIETQLVDLLTDLMHLADYEGVDKDEVLDRALWHYAQDVREMGKATKSPKEWSPRQRRRRR